MCGRAKLPIDVSEIKIKIDFGGDIPPELRRPNYNAAPSQMLPVIRRNAETGERTIDALSWGLIPHWALEPGVRPINAKAERVATAPMFKAAYAKRRCIVPMDGFYEWAAVPGQKRKQPYYITAKDRTPLGVAGIWENWKNPATGEWLRTFAIITCEPNDLCAEIHDRMPVIFDPANYDRWLGAEADPNDLLRPYPAEKMEAWPVSTLVNSPTNNDSSLMDRLL